MLSEDVGNSLDIDVMSVTDLPCFETGTYVRTHADLTTLVEIFKELGIKAFDKDPETHRENNNKIVKLAVDCYLLIEDEAEAAEFLDIIQGKVSTKWVSHKGEPLYPREYPKMGVSFGGSPTLAKGAFLFDFTTELRARQKPKNPKAQEDDIKKTTSKAAESVQAVLVSESVAECIQHLHPLLREALSHKLAAKHEDLPTEPKPDTHDQETALNVIDELNELIDKLLTVNEWGMPNASGKDIIQKVASQASKLSGAGMLKRILVALEIFAKTTLREKLKTPSTKPYDEAEFETELRLHESMMYLIKQPNIKYIG